MSHRDHRRAGGHPSRQSDDRIGRQAGERRRPGRILRQAVLLPEQVSLEGVEADSMAVEVGPIVTTLHHEGVSEPEHQRGVGAGPGCEPLGGDLGRQIVAQRADEHELHAGAGNSPHRRAGPMAGRPARVDEAVPGRHSAECHHQPPVGLELVPADRVVDAR